MKRTTKLVLNALAITVIAMAASADRAVAELCYGCQVDCTVQGGELACMESCWGWEPTSCQEDNFDFCSFPDTKLIGCTDSPG